MPLAALDAGSGGGSPPADWATAQNITHQQLRFFRTHRSFIFFSAWTAIILFAVSLVKP